MAEHRVPAGEASRRRASNWYPLFVAGFLALQVLVFGMALWSTTRPWFMDHDNYPGESNAGYGERLKHADCDVVLYGDSTAGTGLDPDIVAKITGLKTCNIAEGAGTLLMIGGDYIPDEYLRNNKRPRFLLTMWSAKQYNPEWAPLTEFHVEGALFGMQHIPGYFRTLARRPRDLTEFSFWAIRAVFEDTMSRLAFWSPRSAVERRADRDRNLGRWTYPGPPQTDCWVKPADADSTHILRYQAQVERFREHFSQGGTQVIINVTPMADCEPLLDEYKKQTAGLHDNTFDVIPVSYFNDWDVHSDAAGNAYISTAAANQILALEKQQNAQTPVGVASIQK